MSNVKLVGTKPKFKPIVLEVTIDTQELYDNLRALGSWANSQSESVCNEDLFQNDERQCVDDLFDEICSVLVD